MHGINYKKLDNSLSIVELHILKPKSLVNYLSKFLLQVMKKDGEFYPPTKFSSYSYIYFICWFFYLNKVLKKIDGAMFVVVCNKTNIFQALGRVIWSREVAQDVEICNLSLKFNMYALMAPLKEWKWLWMKPLTNLWLLDLGEVSHK